jgi:uncharacterized protein (DUF983 family)
VNGNRQIEMAEMMVTMNNYVAGYAEAMVLGTPQHQLVNPDEPKKKAGMSAEDIARMESEMESLERDLKAVTDNYTENMFTLQTAQTYIKNLLKNAKVVRYLNANHAESGGVTTSTGNMNDNNIFIVIIAVIVMFIIMRVWFGQLAQPILKRMGSEWPPHGLNSLQLMQPLKPIVLLMGRWLALLDKGAYLLPDTDGESGRQF